MLCYIHVMLCYITCFTLCYITYVMLCDITFHVMLFYSQAIQRHSQVDFLGCKEETTYR